MHAIEEDRQSINGQSIKTFKSIIKQPGVQIEVEAGTNGFKGTACRKGGSRAYVRIARKQADMAFEPVTDKDGNIEGFEFATSGDSALLALMNTLGFICEALADPIEASLS